MSTAVIVIVAIALGQAATVFVERMWPNRTGAPPGFWLSLAVLWAGVLFYQVTRVGGR